LSNNTPKFQNEFYDVFVQHEHDGGAIFLLQHHAVVHAAQTPEGFAVQLCTVNTLNQCQNVNMINVHAAS